LKVLHGTTNIANQASIYSKGLNAIGVDSTSVEYVDWFTKFPTDLRFTTQSEINEFYNRAVQEYDTFHFHWGNTLNPGKYDLPLLQGLGKKLYMNFWGSECRQLSIAKRINPYIRVKIHTEELIRKPLELMAEYIPTAIVADYELDQYVRPYFKNVVQLPQAIVCDDYPVCEVPAREELIIVHAPTAPKVKGTEDLFKAVQKLSGEGYKFGVEYIQGMAHDDVKKHYANADVIVDSLTEGVYGLLAIECMSMGKPVIGWITEDAKAYYKETYGSEPPMVSANPDTIYDRLKEMLSGSIDLADIKKKAPEYVRQNHDYLKVAEKLKGIYDN